MWNVEKDEMGREEVGKRRGGEKKRWEEMGKRRDGEKKRWGKEEVGKEEMGQEEMGKELRHSRGL